MFINCVKNVLISKKKKNAFDDIKVDVSFIPSLKALFSWSNAALFDDVMCFLLRLDMCKEFLWFLTGPITCAPSA